MSLRKKTIPTLLLLILIMTLTSTMSISPVFAVPSIYMTPSVNPPAPGPYVGFKWNITLWVTGYGNPPVYAWQVRLNYDPTAGINLTRAWNAVGDSTYIFTGRGTFNPQPDILRHPTLGTVLVGDLLAFGTGETPPPDPAKLAIIEFEIVKAPGSYQTLSTVLDIEDSDEFPDVDTYLLDDSQLEISTTETNGDYTWVGPQPPKPNVAVRRADGQPWPLEFGPSPPPTSQAFDVNVMIENLDVEWGLIEANLTIAYNATVIDIIGGAANITINPTKWTVTSLSVNRSADPELDNVTIHVKPISPWVPNGTVLVATIQFTVVYAGPFGLDIVSDLNFIENVLWEDPGPALIPQNPPVNGKVVIRGMTIEVRVPPHTIGSNQYITNRLETFDVEIWLNDITAEKNVTGVEFRLLYNDTLLEVVDVTEGPFLPSFPNNPGPYYTIFTWVNDSMIDVYGPNLYIANALIPNGTANPPEGSGEVAIITFRGVYRGFHLEENNCTLELVNVLLIDDKYNAIVASPINGYYEILSYRLPAAAFTYSPTFPKPGETVTFNASDSHDFNLGNIISYRWDFGDGNTTTTTQPTIGHVYMAPGAYSVNLTVTDDDGQPSSTAKSITIAKLTSTIDISVAPSTITFGQNTTISGAISPARKHVDVKIRYRTQNEVEWQTVATKVTSAEGNYSHIWTPPQVGTYELTASWLGDNITDSDVSNLATLTVNKATSRLTIQLSKETLTIGSEVTIAGTLSPETPNVSITILSRPTDGKWSTLAIVETDLTGNYMFPWTTTLAGNYELQARFKGNDNMTPSNSTAEVLTIEKQPSNITLNVDPKKVYVGSNVTLSGAITPSRGRVNVTIQYRVGDNATWQTLKVIETDPEGLYTYIWKVDRAGNFEIMASWEGDDNTLPDESDVEAVKVQAQPTDSQLNIVIAFWIANLIIIATAIGATIYYRRKQRPELLST